jgi:hypothetical protein
VVFAFRSGDLTDEDIGRRPDALFRVPMAIQAPLHVQRVFPPHERHFVHFTVA